MKDLSYGKPNIVDLSEIYKSVQQGNIALPIFQRQYVWDTRQKCNLLKSICAELTIGSLIFWKPENPDEPKKKISNYNFGQDLKYLILDGQQRITFLTQLYDESKKPLDIKSFEYYISFPEDGFGIEVQAEKPSPEENKQERSKNSIQKNFKEQRYNLKRLLEEGLSEIKFNTSQKHLKHKEKLLTLRDSIKGPINVYCVNKSRSEALYLYQTCNIAGKKLKSIDLTEAVLSHMWKELMDKIHLLEKKCQKKDGFKIINSENILRCVSTFITKDYQQYNKDILDIFAPKTRHLDSCYDIVSNKFKTYKELNPLTESIVKTQFNNVKASI